MKNKIITFLLTSLTILATSCGNIYYVNQSISSLKWKPEIKVDYILEADSTSESKISYTNENNRQSKIKGFSGSWNKSLKIKNNKKIKYVAKIKNKSMHPYIVKLFVDDKLLQVHKSSGKKQKVIYIFRTF
ncbi:hypothetical protein [Sphingobacterium composti Ten et al. 2007 non Yoo et al. 2007]|uniref:hypothetical protein n=1 Tax=Sphingobacterium composti TaxID=363260 RepID=UPI001358C721|nr:hypothetical protein [Sphingobacterium composti Ten et al. 2007 non Yoo et al. 2007]